VRAPVQLMQSWPPAVIAAGSRAAPVHDLCRAQSNAPLARREPRWHNPIALLHNRLCKSIP
jgi:hypothetical protein